jgi:hypothetical protein
MNFNPFSEKVSFKYLITAEVSTKYLFAIHCEVDSFDHQ